MDGSRGKFVSGILHPQQFPTKQLVPARGGLRCAVFTKVEISLQLKCLGRNLHGVVLMECIFLNT